MNRLKKLYYDLIPSEVRYNFKINVLFKIFAGLFVGCYYAFYGIIAREQFHASPFLISLIITCQSLCGLSGFIMASFVPKGKEAVYSKYIHIIASLFLIGAAFTQSALWFCLMLCCFHFVCCHGPLDDSLLGLIYPLNIRSKMMGYGEMFSSTTNVIITLVVGFVINLQLYNIDVWRIVFVMGGIFFACVGFIRCMYKIKTPQDKQTQNPIEFIKTSFRLLKEDKFNKILIISGILITISLTIKNTLVPIYQVDILHIGGKEVSILAVLSQIFVIVFYPIIGSFFTKTGPVKAWLFVFPLALIDPLFYVLIGTKWYPLIFATFLNATFTVSLTLAWVNLLIYYGGKKRIVEYLAFYGLIDSVRAFIGLLVASLVINYVEKLKFEYVVNLKISFLVSMGFMILAFFVALGLLKYKGNAVNR